MIIDATDLIVGRMGTVVAKKALLGEKIDIVNCENAVISGSKREIISRYMHEKKRGTPAKGPFISRMPDRFVRRIIRGMLPYKKEKGEKAFDNIMCYIGVPKQFEGKKFEGIENADINNKQIVKFITIKDLCKQMGTKL